MELIFLFLIVANVLVEDVSGIGARVVPNNFDDCKTASFYKDKPPEGFESCDSTVCKKICQENNAYATLFNVKAKIPVYSAYQLRFGKSGDDGFRKWDTEPPKGIKEVEISNDFDYDGLSCIFDKGHVAPKAFFVKKDQPATMSYSNAVPQAGNFNRNSWRVIEGRARKYMFDNCNTGSDRYFITGAIPGDTTMKRKDNTDSGVNVPSHSYTAACCSKSTNKNSKHNGKSFSFAYYGKNINNAFENRIEIVEVTELADFIEKHVTGLTSKIKFFDGCDDDVKTAVEDLIEPPKKKIKTL